MRSQQYKQELNNQESSKQERTEALAKVRVDYQKLFPRAAKTLENK
jgi:hypothetical protein